MPKPENEKGVRCANTRADIVLAECARPLNSHSEIHDHARTETGVRSTADVRQAQIFGKGGRAAEVGKSLARRFSPSSFCSSLPHTHTSTPPTYTIPCSR